MQIPSIEPSATRKVATQIFVCFAVVLMCGFAQAQSSQLMRRALRAGQSIATTEVHITPTCMKAGSTSIDIAADHWVARGYDLKTLLSQIYDVDARQMDFSGDGFDARYDVSLTLPREVDEELIQQMLEDALEHKFQLSITSENRLMDVYVLTAPNGPGAALHRHRAPVDAEQITYEGKTCTGVTSGTGISATGGTTISEFQRTLEPDLDRLLIDETNLRGSYDFKIGSYANQQELFNLLREQLGIVVTPAQRKVTIVTVRA